MTVICRKAPDMRAFSGGTNQMTMWCALNVVYQHGVQLIEKCKICELSAAVPTKWLCDTLWTPCIGTVFSWLKSARYVSFRWQCQPITIWHALNIVYQYNIQLIEKRKIYKIPGWFFAGYFGQLYEEWEIIGNILYRRCNRNRSSIINLLRWGSSSRPPEADFQSHTINRNRAQGGHEARKYFALKQIVSACANQCDLSYLSHHARSS